MIRKLTKIFLLSALCFNSAILRGENREDTERVLRANLQGKTLILRRFYKGKLLRFNQDGKLANGMKECAWTICGEIEVGEVNLSGDKLEINGKRAFLRYNNDTKSLGRFLASPVSIEIERDEKTVSTGSLEKLLNNVFLSRDEKLADIVPAYWKEILSIDSPKKTADQVPSTPVYKPNHKSDPKMVNQPKSISAPSPSYTEEARNANYQGSVVLSVVVNTLGQAEDISITKALGMGLDDKAVEAVQHWKFKPGLRNNIPVPVHVLIEVTFRL